MGNAGSSNYVASNMKCEGLASNAEAMAPVRQERVYLNNNVKDNDCVEVENCLLRLTIIFR